MLKPYIGSSGYCCLVPLGVSSGTVQIVLYYTARSLGFGISRFIVTQCNTVQQQLAIEKLVSYFKCHSQKPVESNFLDLGKFSTGSAK